LTTDLFKTSASSSKQTSWGSPIKVVVKALGIEDQQRQNSFVGQTISKLIELYLWLKTVETVKYSARYLYVLADTYYHGRRNAGLAPMNGLKFANLFGIVGDSLCKDENSLSAYDYYKDVVLVTDQDKVVKIGGYAFVPKYDL